MLAEMASWTNSFAIVINFNLILLLSIVETIVYLLAKEKGVLRDSLVVNGGG
jgi:hypothetical protein